MSFVNALFQRYSDTTKDNCPYQLYILGNLSPGRSGNRLIIPSSLSLNGCHIKYAGPERKIRELCHLVDQLDLASNEFSSFSEILKIIKEVPNLRFLNLSENDFSRVNVKHMKPVKCKNMESLVLNNCGVPFNAVRLLLDSMENLSDLHLSLNNYSTLDIGPKKYTKIIRLYISGNPHLTSWTEISNLLEAFPCLERLTMADCNVETIPEDFNKNLPKLKTLNISNWPIKNWECLERLNRLNSLTELRCQGVKVLNSIANPDCKRHHLIARLPKIKRLNGSEITDDERLFAEKAFVRWFLSNKDANKPERFYTLYNIHGKVDPLAEVDLSPPKTAAIKVIYTKNEKMKNMRTDDLVQQIKELKIDLDKSVKDFKMQLSSIFKLPVSKMRLFYVDHVMAEIMGPEELKFNQKKLYTYNIQDGDEFLIDHKSY